MRLARGFAQFWHELRNIRATGVDKPRRSSYNLVMKVEKAFCIRAHPSNNKER